mmetsp:Transcript_24958/g.47821  ORF Transcript_24958/g.47821 Transcript_24958/m.47821 type:complete len:615 (-) Transcript_24958:197-2041(-)
MVAVYEPLTGDAERPAETYTPAQQRVKVPAAVLSGAALLLGLVTLLHFHGSAPMHMRPGMRESFMFDEDDEEDVIDIPIGRIQGRRVQVAGVQDPLFGRQFLGIPYGQARRFDLAEPVPPWHPAILDATGYRPACMRPGAASKDMSEDCLHLNIYTPLPSTLQADKHLECPVIVWFHGGSYMYGAGSDTTAEDVQRLVTGDRIIVVTANYRLGVFGFLGSERLRRENPSQASTNRGLVAAQTGNMGTMDQHLALVWVKQHINHFGGDASRVTVVGWSAGAASASVHLSMPLSHGLFHSAIMLSGGFTDWAAQTMADAEVDYDLLLQKTGCHKEQDCLAQGAPCACLEALPAEELNTIQQQVPITWAPTIDGVVVPLHPMEALRQGKVASGVPIIIGSALADTTSTINDDATEDQFAEFVRKLLPTAAADTAVPLYTSLDPFHKAWLGRSAGYWAARRLGSDKSMTCVARAAARKWKAASGAPAYWFLWETSGPKFDFMPPADTPKSDKLKVGGCWPCPGPGHGSDLPFLFDTGDVHVEDARADLADVVQMFYRNFVMNGDPNTWNGFGLTKDGKQAWTPVEQGGMQFQARHTHNVKDLRGDWCDFWDEQAGRKP